MVSSPSKKFYPRVQLAVRLCQSVILKLITVIAYYAEGGPSCRFLDESTKLDFKFAELAQKIQFCISIVRGERQISP